MHLKRARLQFAAILFCCTSAANAATFTVTSTADSGLNTLRSAITAAVSGPGPNTINFNISGPGVHQINLGSNLPTITTPLLIDGTSQPGYVAGAPLIEVTGATNPFFIQGSGSSGTTIRGLVINGFGGNAIEIFESSANVIASNFIGTDPTGTIAQSGPGGVLVSGTLPAANNAIGGATPALGNLIVTTSTAIGLTGSADSTLIAGNRIGTNATGTALLGTPAGGIFIDGSNTVVGGTAGTTPGGACSGPCNLIVELGGIIFGGPGGVNYGTTIVEGNFIGTDITGTASLAGGIPNPIGIGGTGTGTGTIRIGGTTPAARNLASGLTSGYGVALTFQSPAPTLLIEGNFVGLDTTGTHALSNLFGVRVDGTNATIGGTAAGSANVISGNTADNITLNAATGVVVQGNIIGPAADGVTSLGVTSGEGIFLIGNSNNAIGGTAAGAGNIIAFDQVGIVMYSGTGNAILSNSIFGSTQIPIQLGIGSPIQISNDPCDADTGVNNLQNWPALAQATLSGGSVLVTGNLNSVANTAYTVQIFSNPAGSSAQAKTLLMTTTVTTDATCNAPISVTVPALPIGTIITATATDPGGNTSEVSNGVLVANPLTVTQSFAPASTSAFTNSSLTITIQNPTAAAVSNLAFTDVIAPAGVITAGPPVSTCGGTLTPAGSLSISLSGGSVGANSQCTITIPLSANTAGTYIATIPAGGATGTNAASPTAAIASVQFTAVAPPTATLSFNPPVIALNGTSTLTVTVNNPNPVSFPIAALVLYPTGLTNSSTPAAAVTCPGPPGFPAPPFQANPLDVASVFIAQVPANGSCSMTVQVTSATAGTYLTTIPPGNELLQLAQANTQTASATLTVVDYRVPTLSPLALALLALALAAAAWIAIRR